MKNFLIKIKSYIVLHKIITFIVLILIVLGGYWGYKKATNTSGETRYIQSKVSKGTIVVSVSATGQVSASNQLDLKPKASGDIVYIGAKNGDKVSTGSLIAQLDTKDAEKSVRSAEQSLESAQLSLDKLKITNSIENMTADTEKAYADGFGNVSDAFLDLPSTLSGLEDILGQNILSDNAARISGRVTKTYRDKAENSYYNIKESFNKTRKIYIGLNSKSSKIDIENIINETYETTKGVSDAVKNTLDFVNYVADDSDNVSFDDLKSELATYTTTTTSHLSSLASAQTNIKNNKDSFQNADLDLRSSELSLQQKKDALQDAKDDLADYFVRAPYAGTVTNMTIKKGDQASSSTIIATLITDKQLAEVSMNEVDVAKIKLGEKATLTFDAIPDLTLDGSVEEIDSIGTVSQGVVTYDVKITFDTEDARIKPGMSVSAAIITDEKQNVLVVPNSAVKSQAGRSYVESLNISTKNTNRIPVKIGLANDSESEIVSGINEGDEIITRTILPSTTSTTPAAPSIFGNTRGATGGNVRIPAR